jgi:methanogenic corrinoid protein MtbC1
MGTFTRNDANRNAGDDSGSALPDNWNSYGPAANRVFDSTVSKSVQVERDYESVAVLARAIQHEIIPRLMLAHRKPVDCLESLPFSVGKVSPEEVDAFARLVLSPNEALALDCIDAMRMRGTSIESVYMDLLAPAARALGKFWEDDVCDFSEVTIGLGKLQQILHRLSADLKRSDERPSNGLRILLLPAPGEQHTLGLSMVAEFFRRDGWDVSGGPSESQLDCIKLAGKQHFDMIGFSLAVENHFGLLVEYIRKVRDASLNSRVGIMVGGPIFALYPEYGDKVSADVVAINGREAPDIAEKFITARRALS